MFGENINFLNFLIMKKVFSYFLFSLALAFIFTACNKQEDYFPLTNTKVEKQEAFTYFSKVLSNALDKQEVRTFLKQEALKMVDHDYDVVYGIVKDEMIGKRTFEEFLQESESKLGIGDERLNISNILSSMPLLNIAIPVNPQNWNTKTELPYIVINNGSAKITGTRSDGTQISFAETVRPNVPVIVVGENERMFIDEVTGKYVVDPLMAMFIPESPNKLQECYYAFGELICDDFGFPGGGSGGSGGSGNGSSSCNNGFNFKVYLKGLRSDNLSAIESWTYGAPELRLNILGGSGAFSNDGQNIMEGLWEPRRRRDINGVWWNLNDYLFKWLSPYGDVVWFSWDEEDGGIWTEDTETITVQYGNNTYSVTAPKFLKDNHIHVGTYPVYRDDCFPEIYGTNTLKMKIDIQ